jgi:potassium efflux system protein
MLVLLSLTVWHLFRRTADPLPPAAPTLVQRLRKFWLPLAIGFPLALAALSVFGFQYTAYTLTLNVQYTFALLLVLFVLRALAFRWVLIVRRRIRWQQLTEIHQQRVAEGEGYSGDIAALVAKEEETDLVAMDRQSRRLISLLFLIAGAIGMTSIWWEAIPAVEPILEMPLNPFHDALDGIPRITLGVMLYAVIVLALTTGACRNLPGLIDVLLLGRIGIESSIRYAVTTLSQYAIAILGVIVACQALGMSWSKVHWLVAAMSVGLGFGLQEVVANFICGVLLLFERPLRVGDTVTLADTTGVVVRIRSRATTIRNWDRQEVVIPNKELITGRITNWTLSDDMNRIVIPVGIAYGSDTERAREVLRQILADDPHVMVEPRPQVTFEQFGDSTLNFVVRAYLATMDDRLETIHRLHTSIHRRFVQEGIEISFPQRDVHLRSINPAIRLGGWAVAPMQLEGKDSSP